MPKLILSSKEVTTSFAETTAPKPAAQKQEKTMQDKKDTAANTVVTTSDAVQKPAGRIVDTRTSQVNMDRYNEKYDRLASEKVKTDQTVNKQKLTQRSSQYRGKRLILTFYKEECTYVHGWKF